jgi:c-di-GMP-binding flagellar brake protein YcgR
VSAAILSQLERIERKLDRLLSAQAAGTAPEKEKSLETGQCIDLSGSGILFTSRWAMGKGWFLKLVVDMPDPPGFSVVALGRVVRVDQEPSGSLYVTACQFEAIHEEDREELIAYIFKRHREIAQMRRGQDEDIPEDSGTQI